MRISTIAASTLAFVGLVKALDHFPYPCHKTYEVTADDSCKSIAADIGATSDDIEQWNQDFFENFSCDDISAGQLLCVDYSTTIAKRAVKKPAHPTKKPTHPAKKPSHHKKPAHPAKKPNHPKQPTHPKKVKAAAKKASHPKKPTHHKKPAHPAKKPNHPKQPTHPKKVKAAAKKASHPKKPTHHKKPTHPKKFVHPKKLTAAHPK